MPDLPDETVEAIDALKLRPGDYLVLNLHGINDLAGVERLRDSLEELGVAERCIIFGQHIDAHVLHIDKPDV